MEEIRSPLVIVNDQGQKIFGILHLPPIPNPPLIIISHGFASHKIGTNRSYVRLAEGFCRQGIAAFRFDFRGSGDSEGDMAKMAPQDFVEDLILVAKHFESQGFKKYGFFGSSFGGTLCILGAHILKQVKSIAVWAPVASGFLWHQDRQNRQLQLDLKEYRGVSISNRFKEEFAKLYADKILEHLNDIPFLHFHGENDDTVSLNHKKAFYEARKEAKARTCFKTFAGVDHILGKSPVFSEVLQTTIEWFKEDLR